MITNAIIEYSLKENRISQQQNQCRILYILNELVYKLDSEKLLCEN